MTSTPDLFVFLQERDLLFPCLGGHMVVVESQSMYLDRKLIENLGSITFPT